VLLRRSLLFTCWWKLAEWVIWHFVLIVKILFWTIVSSWIWILFCIVSARLSTSLNSKSSNSVVFVRQFSKRSLKPLFPLRHRELTIVFLISDGRGHVSLTHNSWIDFDFDNSFASHASYRHFHGMAYSAYSVFCSFSVLFTLCCPYILSSFALPHGGPFNLHFLFLLLLFVWDGRLNGSNDITKLNDEHKRHIYDVRMRTELALSWGGV